MYGVRWIDQELVRFPAAQKMSKRRFVPSANAARHTGAIAGNYCVNWNGRYQILRGHLFCRIAP